MKRPDALDSKVQVRESMREVTATVCVELSPVSSEF
jgi:hypothetical protein